jgi:hypothetical protein
VNEHELRVLVREAIARQGLAAAPVPAPPLEAAMRLHASHGLFRLPADAASEGRCLIEPVVACNHCGYCKSYGH